MFECRGCQLLRSENTSLRAQLSDQHELILKMTGNHAEERKQLIEQIMALTRPEVLREYRRPPTVVAQQSQPKEPVRPNFPGFQPDLRPRAKVVKESEG